MFIQDDVDEVDFDLIEFFLELEEFSFVEVWCNSLFWIVFGLCVFGFVIGGVVVYSLEDY